MGVRSRLARLAAQAPVPVFAVAGSRARDAVQDLALDPRVALVATPRRANMLLLAGQLPQPLVDAAAAAHDAMSQPRCTVWWPPQVGLPPPAAPFADTPTVDGDDIGQALADRHRELLTGARRSDEPLLPDEDPNPWRGVGPYGQGGTGMTGGVPYGRPMAERADARDGLALDQIPITVGPLFAGFPTGLVLDVSLQGDVVQHAEVGANPFAQGPATPPAPQPFLRAVAAPTPVAELEMARARRHLRWLAEALAVHGLAALGRRVLRMVGRLGPSDAPAVRGLSRTVRRTRALGWATGGVGVLARDRVEGMGLGPTARAAGVDDDTRTDDPAYRRLGFEPITHERGDASARWRQRLAEAAQALELAVSAGDARTESTGRIEAPNGTIAGASSPNDRLLGLLPELLAGADWGDAVASVASLDLDLEEAAAAGAHAEVSP